MTTSPFANFANAVLEFLVPGDRVILDEFDNPILVTDTLEVTALLKPLGDSLKPQPGVDINQGEFSGYLVNPLELPKTIASGSKAKIVLNGREGEFTLKPNFPNPFVAGAGIKELTVIKGVVRWLN